MPPPTVVCGICKETKNKRQTLAIGDFRACRTHPEVQLFVDEKERTEQTLAKIKKEVEEKGAMMNEEEINLTIAMAVATMMRKQV